MVIATKVGAGRVSAAVGGVHRRTAVGKLAGTRLLAGEHHGAGTATGLATRLDGTAFGGEQHRRAIRHGIVESIRQTSGHRGGDAIATVRIDVVSGHTQREAVLVRDGGRDGQLLGLAADRLTATAGRRGGDAHRCGYRTGVDHCLHKPLRVSLRGRRRASDTADGGVECETHINAGGRGTTRSVEQLELDNGGFLQTGALQADGLGRGGVEFDAAQGRRLHGQRAGGGKGTAAYQRGRGGNGVVAVAALGDIGGIQGAAGDAGGRGHAGPAGADAGRAEADAGRLTGQRRVAIVAVNKIQVQGGTATRCQSGLTDAQHLIRVGTTGAVAEAGRNHCGIGRRNHLDGDGRWRRG